MDTIRDTAADIDSAGKCVEVLQHNFGILPSLTRHACQKILWELSKVLLLASTSVCNVMCPAASPQNTGGYMPAGS